MNQTLLRSPITARLHDGRDSRYDFGIRTPQGIFDEVRARSVKRALTEQLEESMEEEKLTKLEMAKRMATSRSQLDRVLDPENVSVQLDTLINTARAVGKEVEIRIGDPTNRVPGLDRLDKEGRATLEWVHYGSKGKPC